MALPWVIKNPGVKSVPKLKKKGYKKAGPKYGRNVYVAPKPAAAAAPAAPAGPYDAYPDWAKRQLTQIDNDAKFHQSYVADKVIPQASAGLSNLAQFATTANDQYLAQLKGAAQGAYNVAAGSTPMSVSGGPGGIVASPNAYQTQAGSELGRSLGSAAVAIGQHSAMLGKTSPAIMGQGIIANLAEYAKGLPLQYTTKRDERMAELDQFLAEQAQAQADYDEKVRHNKVTEAISATNAESGAAIAFGRLGLDSSKEGYDQTRDTVASSTPAPYGYVRDPATGELMRDPSVPQTTDSTGSGSGTAQGDKYTESWFKEKGYIRVPAKAGARYQSAAIASVDGSGKWLKPGKAGAKPTAAQVKAAAGSKPFDVQKALLEAYNGGMIDDVDQGKGTPALLRFLQKYQPTNKKNFNKWWASILPVLRDQSPNFAAWMSGYITRRQREGTWKGVF